MIKLAALLLTLAVPAQAVLATSAHAEVLLEEIRTNLDDAKAKVEAARKQIGELEDNDGKLKKNIQEVDGALGKKLGEQKQAKETLNDYNGKLTGTSTAKKEFERSLVKDRQELELVVRDIQTVERKLVALKASKKALEESIEISEDNLGKMNDRSGSWQKNRDHLQGELTALDKDIQELEKQKETQEKARLQNQQALNSWKKTLSTQEATYQKLETRYKQAVRDEEKKQKEKGR